MYEAQEALESTHANVFQALKAQNSQFSKYLQSSIFLNLIKKIIENPKPLKPYKKPGVHGSHAPVKA